MNRTAQRFLDAYGVELHAAIDAWQKVLKIQQDHETDPVETVAGIFFLIMQCHLHECSCAPSREMSEFTWHCRNAVRGDYESIEAMDREKVHALLLESSSLMKEQYGEDVFELPRIAATIIRTLHVCHAYDQAMHTEVRQGMVAAITRFTHLLISTGNPISESENRFLARFKAALAATTVSEADSTALSGELAGSMDQMIALESIKAEAAKLSDLLRVQ